MKIQKAQLAGNVSGPVNMEPSPTAPDDPNEENLFRLMANPLQEPESKPFDSLHGTLNKDFKNTFQV